MNSKIGSKRGIPLTALENGLLRRKALAPAQWWVRRDSNPHCHKGQPEFQAGVSTGFATNPISGMRSLTR